MKVGIVGGGASGLMAAITAAAGGHDVVVLEHMARVGKKLLLTGSGKCNLSNVDMDIKHFHGTNPSFAAKILDKFGRDDAVEFFEEIGLHTKEKKGGIYPFCEQASAVLDVLRFKARAEGVEIITECDVRMIKYRQSAHPCANIRSDKNSRFALSTSNGDYYFDALIIASGSYAAPKTGADGSGYSHAAELGHTIIKPLPALTQLRCKEDFFSSIAGIRTPGRVSLYINDKFASSDSGEIQLTNYGISGIPVFQVSHLASRAIDEGKSVTASLCFMPELIGKTMRDSILTCAMMLSERFKTDPLKTAEESLIGLLNKNLGNCILKRNNISPNMPSDQIDNKQIAAVAKTMMDFKVTVTQTNSFDDAQVVSGGVDTSELTYNLESKFKKGLYFAGEIIDIHGDCGGYNLQWAWSSGNVAGRLESE